MAKAYLALLLILLLLLGGCTYYLYKEEEKGAKRPVVQQSTPAPTTGYDAREGQPVTTEDMRNYMDFEVEHACGSPYSYSQLLEKYSLSGRRLNEITNSSLYNDDVKKAIMLEANKRCPRNK